MGLLILFFLISIIFSFLCSIWEAVLLSIPPSHVAILGQEDSSTGSLLKKLKDNIDEPLAAILTLNTIAHTAGAIGVGAQAAKIWEDTYVFGINIASVVVPTVMTLAILILSEIIPKTLGATYWKQLTPFTVRSLNVLNKILSFFIWMSNQITRLIKKDDKTSVFSRAEFKVMTEIGEKQGIFEQSESLIIRNLLRFNTIQAKSIMTPRTVVKAANENTSIQEFYEQNKGLPFSRIPVFKESKDHINGFVLKDEVLGSIINNHGDNALTSIKREILIVNENIVLPDLFNKLLEKREHIALVVDEFGGMAGIITMEDVIETLLGLEIVDEYDDTEDMQILARKNWEKRAKALGIISEQDDSLPKETS